MRHAATKLLPNEVWCPECDGTGKVWVGPDLIGHNVECSCCGGTGKLDEGIDEDE